MHKQQCTSRQKSNRNHYNRSNKSGALRPRPAAMTRSSRRSCRCRACHSLDPSGGRYSEGMPVLGSSHIPSSSRRGGTGRCAWDIGWRDVSLPSRSSSARSSSWPRARPHQARAQIVEWVWRCHKFDGFYVGRAAPSRLEFPFNHFMHFLEDAAADVGLVLVQLHLSVERDARHDQLEHRDKVLRHHGAERQPGRPRGVVVGDHVHERHDSLGVRRDCPADGYEDGSIGSAHGDDGAVDETGDGTHNELQLTPERASGGYGRAGRERHKVCENDEMERAVPGHVVVHDHAERGQALDRGPHAAEQPRAVAR
eukprot:PhM_4_TR18058/c0_g1_i2/m.40919